MLLMSRRSVQMVQTSSAGLRIRSSPASVGRSILHAAHQLAQRLTSVTWPGLGASVTSFPLISCSFKGGGALRVRSTMNWVRPLRNTGGLGSCAPAQAGLLVSSRLAAASSRSRRAGALKASAMDVGPAFALQFDDAADA